MELMVRRVPLELTERRVLPEPQVPMALTEPRAQPDQPVMTVLSVLPDRKVPRATMEQTARMALLGRKELMALTVQLARKDPPGCWLGCV